MIKNLCTHCSSNSWWSLPDHSYGQGSIGLYISIIRDWPLGTPARPTYWTSPPTQLQNPHLLPPYIIKAEMWYIKQWDTWRPGVNQCSESLQIKLRANHTFRFMHRLTSDVHPRLPLIIPKTLSSMHVTGFINHIISLITEGRALSYGQAYACASENQRV